MYSIGFVAKSQNKSLHKVLEGRDRFEQGVFDKYDLSVVPHPGVGEQDIRSLMMKWHDASGNMLSFESSRRPFIFENLPQPPMGDLNVIIEALDEHGQALENLTSTIAFDVVPESSYTAPEHIQSSDGVFDRDVSANSEKESGAAETEPTKLPGTPGGVTPERGVTQGDVSASAKGISLLALDTDAAPQAAANVALDDFVPIRIQAEDTADDDGVYATLSGPGIDVVDDPSEPNTNNAEGGAYVDYVEASGESLTFTFSVAEAGEYDLALGYALSQNDDGSERNRPLRLDVNDELVDRMFDLRSTTLNADSADFSEFGEQVVRVALQVGENTVTFTSNGASGPNIDYLEVRAPDPNVHVIQAEDMSLSPQEDVDDSGTNRVVTSDSIVDFTDGNETFRVGAEGQGYLDWALNNADAWSEFSIDVAVAGTYTVTTTYASSSARPLPLSLVDGDGQLSQLGSFNFAATAPAPYYPDDVDGEVATANLPSDGLPSEWEGWNSESIEVHLEAGTNTLRLGGATNGPNIDKVEVALLAADPVDPTGPVIDPIVIQAEDAQPGVDNDPDTTVRDASNPEAGTSFQGLRPDYSGDGYVDFGSVPGDLISFTVNVVEAGSYDLNFRYASNGARSMEMNVNAGPAVTLGFAGTDLDDDPLTEGFDQWGYQTLSTELQAGDNIITLAIPASASSGPNIDRLEVTTQGSGPVGDVTADVADDLLFTAANTLVNADTAAAADFNVTGLDDDVVYVGVSFDGGVTVTEVVPDADGNFSVDIGAQPDGDLNATFIVLDAFGNRAEQGMALSLDTTADENGDLSIIGPADPVPAANANAVTFNLTGLDGDIVSAEASFDGGATRSAVGVDGTSLLLDLSSQAPGDVSVALYVTDSAGNEASTSTSLVLEADTTDPLPDAVDVVFNSDAITSWNAIQDLPVTGNGVAIEDDGATLALLDNTWKRFSLGEDFLITEDTVLTLDLTASSSPLSEIIAIGFDTDDNPFNGGNSVYQLGGSQSQAGFVDLRGQGVDNGDGSMRFSIDLSAHAGQTVGSLVLVNDDDIGKKGSARFSNVQLSSDTGTDINSAPRVVGNGIADMVVAERSTLEVDLPFVDDDGDDMAFSVNVADASGNVVNVDGLSFDGLVLTGSLGDMVPGAYTVTVTADDGQATTATDFALTVENVNDAPVVEPAALEPYFGQVGESFIQIELAQFAPLFSDPDGDALTLSAENLPAGLEVVDGFIQGTPEEAGSFDITVSATDPGGLSATQILNFEIEEQAPLPSVTIEAEDFTDLSAANIVATGNVSASNEQLIRMISTDPASVSTELDAAGVTPGWYAVRLYVYDETDGAGSLTLTIGDTVLEARNASSNELSSQVVLNDDFGTLVGSGARGSAGQSGNRKEIIFETPVQITAGMLATLALQAEGGELMRIDSLILDPTTAPDNTAPTLAGLDAELSIDENSTAVASLVLDDADDDDLSVSLEGIDAALFSYDADTGTLSFVVAPDAEIPVDDNEDGVYELTVVVSDGTTSVSQQTLVSVADINESLSIAPATLSVDENLTEVGTIPVVDENGEAVGLDAPVYTITGGVDAPLFSIDSDTGVLSFISPRDYELAVDADEDGVYEVEVSVTDGDLSTTETIAVTVTDVNEDGFTPISLQAEDGTIILQDDGSNATVTTVRDADNPETGSGFSGLRPDYSGTGYIDFGDTAGDTLSFDVDVLEAGTYDLNIRYASNTARPLDLVINDGSAQEIPFASTDPDGTGVEEGFDHWVFQTVTVTLGAGSNTISLAIPPGATTGPNIDRLEITEAGSGPIPVDDSADVDGNLALSTADDTLSSDQLETVAFNVSGADDDIVSYAISLDGGTTRAQVTPDANGDVTLDLSGLSGSVDVMLFVTDAAGNEASATESVTIDDSVDVDPFTLQAEDGSVNDTGDPANGDFTRVVDPDNLDAFGNHRPGAVGDAYVDFGTDAGDELVFNVDAPVAGTYTATIRYANGGDAARPLELSLNGASPSVVSFTNAVDDGVNDPWDEWLTLEVEVSLEEGANTFSLSIPDAANGGVANGPNIDQVIFSPVDGGNTDPQPFDFVIEGEALTIDDTDNVGDTLDTQVRDPSNPETNDATGADGLWDGFTGTGYLDMGGDAGDAGSFEVTVDEAGTYSLTVRYTNGDGAGAARPMNVLVGSADQGSFGFDSTGVGNPGWENWQEETIEVELEAGTNTIRLENVGTAGPNIDNIRVSRDGDQPPREVEPGDRFSVKINFQPEGVAVPDGYVADTGKAFGEQSINVDGQAYQYGWVTEASIADGTDNGTVPLDISSLTSVAVNDRTDDIAGLDPRQGTYAHFDQPSTDYVRAGWEIELEDGYYEVTISIGDTSGSYDSNNVLNAEGELFNDPFTPSRPDDFPADDNPADDTDGVRSDLVTRVVQVIDGRLTLDSIGLDNENTEIQYIEIQSLPDLTPDDDREAPEDYALFTDARAIAGVGQNEVEVDLDSTDDGVPTGVDPTSDIFVGISVVDGRGGALLESLADGSIRLFETVSGEEVTFNANTTGGFDSLTISPSQTLKPFTSYTLVIEGFQDRGPNDDPDAPTREFQKYTNTFVTGEEPEIVPRDVAFDDVVELDGAADNAFGFTSLEISGDGQHMYVATIGGQLLRYDVDPIDGSLGNRVELSLPSDYFFQPGADSSNDRRGIIGLTTDPTDPNVLWITDNYPIPLSGRDNGVPDFSGRVTKITLDDGPGFSGVAEPYITGLPRSNGDHVTNSLEFRENPDYDPISNPDAPTHLLYLIQGSNSAMGEPDSAWGNRPERLLNAAVLEIDPTRDAPPGGFDVTTEPLPEDGLNRRFADDDDNVKDDPIPMGNGEFLVFDDQGVATVQNADGDILEEYYDPYADGAVLTLFSTGTRNAYDLVWHSNGFLYVPTNGSAAGGNVPDNPNTPEDERYTNVEKQDDYLFRITEDGYYGHPNPLRDEYILNGGNPTAGNDPGQVTSYPEGTNPEGTYDLAGVYSLGENRSPNGAVEYTSGIFGGNLQGNVLFTEYSGGDDIRTITLDANGNVTGDDVLRDVDGNVISYIDPLDIIENPATGQLYLLTLNRGNGQSQIIRLDPVPGGTVDPDPGTDDLESVLAIQAEDKTPDDGSAATIATGTDAEIQIRDIDNPETNQDLPNGLRPGAYGVDGNTNGGDGVPGGYADFGETNNDFLTFTFDLEADQSGDSVLRIRYANGGDVNRPLEVFVNNVSVGVVNFPPSSLATEDARWADWLSVDIPAALVSGQNTVRLQATDNIGPNIDQLEILQDPATASGFDEYEAESAQLDGPAVVLASDDDRNASGDGFVDFDGSGDQTISWTIEVDEAGSYEIGFRYALASTKADRPLGLTINGIDIGQVNFVGQSNAAESDWFYQDVLVNLQGGSNTITVTAPGAVGPNIDLLRVPSSAADDFVPVYADVTDGSRIELESGDSARSINELTADFYFSVDENGLYRLDLAANAGADAGGSLALTLNGQPIDTLAYPGEGNAGEEGVWVELLAGQQYNLRAVSAADGADDIDYLDITPIAGNDNADIDVQSGDPAYFSNRLHFNYLEDNGATNPDRDFKESATVTISNSGSETLEILDATIDGPFVLADPSVFDGLSLSAGTSIDVTVLFDRDAYTAPTTDAGDGVFEGSIRLTTNDADSPVAEIHMAGFWQARDEGGWEPNVNEVWEVFGFGNRIDGLSTVDGGGNSVLNDFDLYRPVNDDEVLSRYWTLADGVGEAKITQLAAFHGGGGATLGIHNPGNKGQDVIFSNHAGDNNQSILPLLSNGEFATANFELSDIPSGWLGNGVFGFEVANLSTDPSLNPTGGGTPPADADGIERGYTVRMFRALDADGNVIPDTYLGIMDYTGINYDYNDNVFLIEGVSPVTGGDLTVINNDGVPSDDRLVMSRIENPANGDQQVHDVATLTLRNDGFEDLAIDSVEVSDPSLFELVSAFDPVVLEPGQSIDVEVQFIASDDDDGSLYEASLIINSSDPDEGEKVVTLAGIAQGQSENGQEPTVQEIVNAFGYSTDVAQGQMNQGGLVEANGDEILAPYFQRADGGSPIKITQLAAYHTQGDIARLFIHDVDSRDINEIIAHDEADGQTLLPRTLNNGSQLASINFDRDDPFGFFAEISGRQGYISWSDPDANLYEDTIDAIGTPGTNLNWDENDGHLIRVYTAKDAAGNVIPDTYIVIQDYAGVNYDYNDNIFLVENVTTYDPTGAEDADGNGRVDLYDDDDGDGVPNFIDNPSPDDQTAFNGSETPWSVGSDGLTLEAKLYDNGGQGVAYNDTTTAHQGEDYRSDEAVDITFGTQALGYIADGEWVEYTLNVEQAGTYTLNFLASATTGGKSITAAFEQGGSFYTDSQTVGVTNTDSFTSFEEVGPLTFDLEEGEQVLRLTFNGGQLDLASLTLDQVAVANEQTAFNGSETPWSVGSDGLTLEAKLYDNGGQGVAYNDTTAAHDGEDYRADEAVDITFGTQALGYIADGEWVEYTLNVEQAGTYTLNFLASATTGGKSITAAFEQGGSFYTDSQTVGVTDTDDFTSFDEVGPLTFELEEGEQTLRLTFNGGQLDLASFTLDQVAVAGEQQPYNATQTPWQVDADGLTLDAVNYDTGGQDLAYNDSSETQLGSDFRDEGVDIVGNGDAVGWVEDGEWIEYTINVSEAGNYDLSFLSALGDSSNGAARSITASFAKGGDSPYVTASSVEVPPTGSWSDFQPTEETQVQLEQGEQVLRLTFGGGSLDLASFSLSRDGQQAFNAGGTPWQVDADTGLELDAALFDEGEQDVAYNELSSDQLGSSFRDTPVDIVGQGDAVGWIEDGEWVEYTINVEQAGTHTLNFVTSNPSNGRSITASAEKGGSVYDEASTATPNSGAWGSYNDSASVSLDLEAGIQVLRLTFNGGSQDLASFQVSREADAQPTSQSFSTLLALNEPEMAPPVIEEPPASDDVGLQGVQDDDSGSLI